MATSEKISSSEAAAAAAAARSHGRGGAGNMSSKPAAVLDANALQTPTIKSALYTTGRGGTGNMAQNNPNDPAAARAAQDVEAPQAHNREIKGTYHWGRGGEGNMMTVGNNKAQQQRSGSPATDGRPPNSRNASGNNVNRRTGSFNAVMEKGREIFGLNAKKDAAAAAQNENAIE